MENKFMPRPRSMRTIGHDVIAQRLARQLGTEYRRKGVDLVSKGVAWEVVVTLNDLYTSISQLRRSRASKKYMVVPRPLITSAKKLLKNTGIGIATTSGKIVKRSRRRTR